MSLPRNSTSARRLRIDLRRLPYGAGYMIALAVVALVLFLAYRASAGRVAPGWWTDYAVPAIYWSSPVLIVIAIAYRMRRRRKQGKMNDSNTT